MATIIIQNCLYSLGHGIYQSFTGSNWNALPLLHDDVVELADIWDFVHLHLPLEDPPKMFYWVQVWRHAWPVHHLYPQPLQSSSGRLRGAFGVIVMLNTVVVIQFLEGGDHALLQYFRVHVGVHVFPCWNVTLQHLQHSSSPRLWHFHHHVWL